MALTTAESVTLRELDPVASSQPAAQKPFTFSSTVEYRSQGDAEMVKKALDVDAELRPELVSRRLQVDGNKLMIEFAAVDARTLRASVGTFCDLLGLATRTLEAFGS